MDITQAMRYRIDSEIEIEATSEQVWKVFGDFGSYSKWNDFQVFKKVPEAVGKKCEVVFHLEGGCMKTSSHDPEVRCCAVDTSPEGWASSCDSSTAANMQE